MPALITVARPRAGSSPTGPAGTRPPRWPATSTPRLDAAALLTAVHRLARLYLEIETGRREPCCTGPRDGFPVQVDLRALKARPGPQATVVRVRGVATAADVFDAVVLLREGPRCGVLAVRLRREGRFWRAETIDRPEAERVAVGR